MLLPGPKPAEISRQAPSMPMRITVQPNITMGNATAAQTPRAAVADRDRRVHDALTAVLGVEVARDLVRAVVFADLLADDENLAGSFRLGPCLVCS
jgi:hypothetical protein